MKTRYKRGNNPRTQPPWPMPEIWPLIVWASCEEAGTHEAD
jgi:hypothetical protein